MVTKKTIIIVSNWVENKFYLVVNKLNDCRERKKKKKLASQWRFSERTVVLFGVDFIKDEKWTVIVGYWISNFIY